MSSAVIELLRRTTCPHCWHPFAPEDVLWISAHADLRGDPRLGPDQNQRFLATRFNPDGAALDAKDFACTNLACPNCHLSIARPLLEIEPFFVSILGTPSCGKSYFLAALTWELRRLLPQEFALGFTDADAAANLLVSDYEKALFLSANADQLVPLAHLIRKTELQGELYDTVTYGSQSVSYPRPFQFVVRPLPEHPNHAAGNRAARVICLYDNAGEHCLPGQESTANPAIQHLSRSRVLFFLFDPTQDPRFRKRYQTRAAQSGIPVTNRQEFVLLEAAGRVRRYLSMPQNAKHDRPLVVVLTKSDIWGRLLPNFHSSEPWLRRGAIAGLDLERIEKVSHSARELLIETCPEIVDAAENFASNVLYVPASALGSQPEIDPSSGLPAIRARDIRPSWVTAPLLAGLRLGLPGLISRLKSKQASATVNNGPIHDQFSPVPKSRR